MKKILLTAALVLAVFPALAQSQTAEEYMKRYENLVSRVGTSGLGVETLLDKWEADWPEDLDMLQARFLFCFDKSQSVQMVAREQARFLGQAPTLALKDSLGKDVNYFQETFYDDELFGQGIRYIEKASSWRRSGWTFGSTRSRPWSAMKRRARTWPFPT